VIRRANPAAGLAGTGQRDRIRYAIEAVAAGDMPPAIVRRRHA